MTGFGSAEGVVGSSRVSVELRTVNHRFFNPSVKLPSAFSRWESEVREALRKLIARGHVTVSARIERPETADATVDDEKFGHYAAALIALRDRHKLGGEIDVATVMRMPDVIRVPTEETIEGTVDELVAIVGAAAAELTKMRDAEGARLATVLLERVGLIEEALVRIAARAPERVVAQRDRLRENVKVLAEGIAVDEQRLAQEIAILADRLDVGEEIDRFWRACSGLQRRGRRAGRRTCRQATRFFAAGNAARDEHDRQQGERHANSGRRDSHQGRARANSRAGREP